MRKVQIGITFIVYLLTTMVNFGQTKQGEKLNTKDKFKFDPTEQALKDLNEKDTTGIDISIIDYISPKHYRSEKEMNLLLQKYNLNNDSVFYSRTENEEPEYIIKKSVKLRERIDKKFGVNFIDSLRNIAEKQYVLNNIDKVFEYEECDTVSRYTKSKYYRNYYDYFDRDFWKVVKYPKDFKYRNEKDLYSYLEAKFILHKDGKVSGIKTWISFKNMENDKYATYFTKELIRFVEKSKWLPATSMGITVTSVCQITILFR